MKKNQFNQENPYKQVQKIVQKMISGDNPDVLSMLKSLVSEIVNTENFDIIGGRIWELNPKSDTYKLSFQYGTFNKVPENYEIQIKDQPILKELPQKKVMLSNETDFVLQELGIKLYSVIGVGEIVKTKTGRYFEYVLGFNAPEIHQSFFELLNIIEALTTTEILNIKRKLRMRNEQKKLRRDLDKASEIQRDLLPNHEYKFHDFDIYGVCIQSEGVGGDYFDYIVREDIENESLGIVISDSMSHGLQAAVQSNFVSGAIRMGLSYATRMVDIFNKLNSLIYEQFKYKRFATLFYCELTLSDNRLGLYVNAGHPPPLHFYKRKNLIKKLKQTGGMLGLTKDQKFGLENFRLKKGDILVLYTDGITEAGRCHYAGEDSENSTFEDSVYGNERLEELILKNKNLSAKALCLVIWEGVLQFSAIGIFKDVHTIKQLFQQIEKYIQKGLEDSIFTDDNSAKDLIKRIIDDVEKSFLPKVKFKDDKPATDLIQQIVNDVQKRLETSKSTDDNSAKDLSLFIMDHVLKWFDDSIDDKTIVVIKRQDDEETAIDSNQVS